MKIQDDFPLDLLPALKHGRSTSKIVTFILADNNDEQTVSVFIDPAVSTFKIKTTVVDVRAGDTFAIQFLHSEGRTNIQLSHWSTAVPLSRSFLVLDNQEGFIRPFVQNFFGKIFELTGVQAKYIFGFIPHGAAQTR